MIKIYGFPIVLLTQKMGKRAEFSIENLQILDTFSNFFLFGGGEDFPHPLIYYIYTPLLGAI